MTYQSLGSGLPEYIASQTFSKKPLILGEAPSPLAPNSSWPRSARTTHKLANIIFGSASEDSLNQLFEGFDFINLLPSYPGTVFPNEIAVKNLRHLYRKGFLKNRITFFMGKKSQQALQSLPQSALAAKFSYRYNPDLGCKNYVAFNRNTESSLFIIAPHPQIYFRFISKNDLQNLGQLFRCALIPMSKAKRAAR